MNTRILKNVWRVILALVFSLSFALIPAQEAHAATYNVSVLTDSGAGSLRAAITAANANPSADTITFTVSGDIPLASALPHISDDLTIDGAGRSISINGMDAYQVLYVNSGKTVEVRNLAITYGYTTNSSGGGIYNGGTLVLTNVLFFGNRSQYHGGAVFNYLGTVAVFNSSFSNNSLLAPSSNGGAISNYQGVVSVVNSSFSGNTADYGGAISNYIGTLRVTNSTFAYNTADNHGGAIYTHTGKFHLKNSILAESFAPEDCYSDAALASDIRNLIEVNWGCGTPYSSADPELGYLGDNGGPTWTMAISPTSPALDAGSDAVCAAAPVSNLDQRGISRPRGAHCDIGSYELDKGRLIFRSSSSNDGWILESGEDTTAGGTLNSTATVFNLGDDASDRQYRALLSFDTSDLPDAAVLTRVMLKIRYQGLVGTDPFSILGGLKVDMREPYFGTALGLAAADFQAVAGRSNAATFRTTPTNNWYIAIVGATGYPYINLSGTTQFRLRFLTDDNNDDSADYMKFFSGDHVNSAVHPTLVIDFDLP